MRQTKSMIEKQQSQANSLTFFYLTFIVDCARIGKDTAITHLIGGCMLRKIVDEETADSSAMEKAEVSKKDKKDSKKPPVPVLLWLLPAFIILVWFSLIVSRSNDLHATQEHEIEMARAKQRAPLDSTSNVVFTSEWSKPVSIKTDQCVHFTPLDPTIDFEEKFDDGSTMYVPAKTIPGVTKTKIIAANGNVLQVITADKYGRFSLMGHHGRQIRIMNAPQAVIEVRINDI